MSTTVPVDAPVVPLGAQVHDPVQAAIERANTRQDQDHIFFGITRSTCPECLALINAQILFRDGQVFMRKFCPEHGHFEALMAADADWWLHALSRTKPGTIPLWHATQRKTQCPEDCGLCDDHQQHTCYPLIEITDHCDLHCPICFARNQHAWYLSPEQMTFMLDRLAQAEGRAEIVCLTGGEPTVHPQFFELLDIAINHPVATKVAVNTHGLRLARDEEFVRRIAETGAYIQLQFDGFKAETYRRLRGADLSKMKRLAFDHLAKYNVKTLLITTIAQDLNEDAVGETIRLVLENDFIHSLTLQPLIYCGDALSNHLPHDMQRHITLTTILNLLEAQMDGLMTKEDFVSIPCSHPSCSAVGYFLKAGPNDWVSLARITQADKMLNYLQNRLLFNSEQWMRDLQSNLETLWSASAVMESEKVGRALSCCAAAYAKDKTLVGMGKMIGVHGFMDPSTYDQSRAMKCCYHVLTTDGRMMPFCNYNIFHREKDMQRRNALARA
ncbi:MAG TPA: radical SAM protein [Anaerolineae bacterium]|nr:radical SAM protein [Anaerolineae bacterium]